MSKGVFLGGKAIGQITDRARLAEDLGYETCWVIQVADREATIVAAAVASATSKISVGTGVLPTYPRTPAVMAQTAATIDEIAEGRFILGLGPSHKLTIEAWHGMELTRPIASVREYVEAIRSILHGRAYSGEIYRTAFQFLSYSPRQDLPIYLSCLAPQMCKLTGEVADGAVLWMCAPRYIADVVLPKLEEGRAAAEREKAIEVVAAVPVSLTGDPAGGRDAFRRVSTVYWNLPFYRGAVERAGFGAALSAFDEKGPPGIPDEVIDEFCGIGDEAACLAAVQRYRDSGVTMPAISVLPSHEGAASWEETVTALAGA